MAHHAHGTFEVKVNPQPPEDNIGDPAIGRMSLDKQFIGDLTGSGKGQMLSVGTAVDGSAAYVAMELVTGSLHGRSGTFALHHTGVMSRGTPQLQIMIVPDSGTDQLLGISGSMNIDNTNGDHAYTMEYELTDPV